MQTIKLAQLFAVKKVNIWDLDGTVIDSAHRVLPCIKENGDLDLDKYKREACKHELIQQDRLMPLVELMRHSMSDPDTINYIVTARLLSKSDYYYLRRQGLRGRGLDNVQVFSRDTLHKHMPLADVPSVYHSGDAKYKAAYFDVIKQRHGDDVTYTMYDDHRGVLATAQEYGFNAVDATALNDMLTIGIKLASEQFLDETINDDLDIDYLNQKLKFAWLQLSDEEKVYYSAQYPQYANIG